MRQLLLAGTLTATLLICGAKAEAGVRLIGAGVVSCGTWTADRKKDWAEARLDEQWILGFLSGIGHEGDRDPLHDLDAQAVWAWVDNFCRANPLDTIWKAGSAFAAARPR